MKSATTGSVVKVHYTGKLDDGTVLDSSRERSPLEFTIGSGQLIKGFDNAVNGMETGEEKTVKIPAVEAYGEHRSDLLVEFEKKQFPENADPKVGYQLDLKSPDGRVVNAVITSVEDDMVTLDANHPLAGKDLTFEIELVDVR
jgi:FKBP-type peptidyl-prolyl cis-trans isomerase 2